MSRSSFFFHCKVHRPVASSTPLGEEETKGQRKDQKGRNNATVPKNTKALKTKLKQSSRPPSFTVNKKRNIKSWSERNINHLPPKKKILRRHPSTSYEETHPSPANLQSYLTSQNAAMQANIQANLFPMQHGWLPMTQIMYPINAEILEPQVLTTPGSMWNQLPLDKPLDDPKVTKPPPVDNSVKDDEPLDLSMKNKKKDGPPPPSVKHTPVHPPPSVNRTPVAQFHFDTPFHGTNMGMMYNEFQFRKRFLEGLERQAAVNMTARPAELGDSNPNPRNINIVFKEGSKRKVKKAKASKGYTKVVIPPKSADSLISVPNLAEFCQSKLESVYKTETYKSTSEEQMKYWLQFVGIEPGDILPSGPNPAANVPFAEKEVDVKTSIGPVPASLGMAQKPEVVNALQSRPIMSEKQDVTGAEQPHSNGGESAAHMKKEKEVLYKMKPLFADSYQPKFPVGKNIAGSAQRKIPHIPDLKWHDFSNPTQSTTTTAKSKSFTNLTTRQQPLLMSDKENFAPKRKPPEKLPSFNTAFSPLVRKSRSLSEVTTVLNESSRMKANNRAYLPTRYDLQCHEDLESEEEDEEDEEENPIFEPKPAVIGSAVSETGRNGPSFPLQIKSTSSSLAPQSATNSWKPPLFPVQPTSSSAQPVLPVGVNNIQPMPMKKPAFGVSSSSSLENLSAFTTMPAPKLKPTAMNRFFFARNSAPNQTHNASTAPFMSKLSRRSPAALSDKEVMPLSSSRASNKPKADSNPVEKAEANQAPIAVSTKPPVMKFSGNSPMQVRNKAFQAPSDDTDLQQATVSSTKVLLLQKAKSRNKAQKEDSSKWKMKFLPTQNEGGLKVRVYPDKSETTNQKPDDELVISPIKVRIVPFNKSPNSESSLSDTTDDDTSDTSKESPKTAEKLEKKSILQAPFQQDDDEEDDEVDHDLIDVKSEASSSDDDEAKQEWKEKTGEVHIQPNEMSPDKSGEINKQNYNRAQKYPVVRAILSTKPLLQRQSGKIVNAGEGKTLNAADPPVAKKLKLTPEGIQYSPGLEPQHTMGVGRQASADRAKGSQLEMAQQIQMNGHQQEDDQISSQGSSEDSNQEVKPVKPRSRSRSSRKKATGKPDPAKEPPVQNTIQTQIPLPRLAQRMARPRMVRWPNLYQFLPRPLNLNPNPPGNLVLTNRFQTPQQTFNAFHPYQYPYPYPPPPAHNVYFK